MIMDVAKRLDGIGEYYFSAKLREIDSMNKAGKNVINLGIGSPDLPPHPEVIKTLCNEAGDPGSHAYQGYRGIPVLRQAIATFYNQWYGVVLNAETEVLPLMGSKEGIMHICMSYINDGDEVLIPDPGYPTYSSAVKLSGGVCKTYELKEENNYLPDLNSLKSSGLEKVKLMWVNYPHMPTGALPTKSFFESLVSFAKENQILICHDNPYSFVLNDAPMSILSVPGAMDVAIELNSLSKSFNMAGWRVGMLCGAANRINEILIFKSNMDSGMFKPVQLAAARALTANKEWFDSLNNTYRERRKIVFKLLDLIGCRYILAQAGLFVWAKVPEDYSSGYELSDTLLNDSNVFVTPGGIFGEQGKNYIRVSLCNSVEKIEEALNRISITRTGKK